MCACVCVRVCVCVCVVFETYNTEPRWFPARELQSLPWSRGRESGRRAANTHGNFAVHGKGGPVPPPRLEGPCLNCEGQTLTQMDQVEHLIPHYSMRLVAQLGDDQWVSDPFTHIHTCTHAPTYTHWQRIKGFSCWVTRSRSLSWRQKFHHWVQC